MSISDYAELKILDHLSGRVLWAKPNNVYVKLHIGDPGEDGTGFPAVNTTRVLVGWNAAASGAISSNAALTWSTITTAETYSHWSLWDDPSGGNCLWKGELSSPAAVTSGDSFQINTLTLGLN